MPLPGASASVSALFASGLVNYRFHFASFLPAKSKQRDAALAALANMDATIVLYEAPHRIVETVDALLAADAHREKGEYVVLVEGASAAGDAGDAEAERILAILLEECSVKQAAALAAKITGQKKNALYDKALRMKQGESES